MFSNDDYADREEKLYEDDLGLDDDDFDDYQSSHSQDDFFEQGLHNRRPTREVPRKDYGKLDNGIIALKQDKTKAAKAAKASSAAKNYEPTKRRNSGVTGTNSKPAKKAQKRSQSDSSLIPPPPMLPSVPTAAPPPPRLRGILSPVAPPLPTPASKVIPAPRPLAPLLLAPSLKSQPSQSPGTATLKPVATTLHESSPLLSTIGSYEASFGGKLPMEQSLSTLPPLGTGIGRAPSPMANSSQLLNNSMNRRDPPTGFKQRVQKDLASSNAVKELKDVKRKLAASETAFQLLSAQIGTEPAVPSEIDKRLAAGLALGDVTDTLRRQIICNNVYEVNMTVQQKMLRDSVLEFYGIDTDTDDESLVDRAMATAVKVNVTKVQGNLRTAIAKSFKLVIGPVLRDLGWLTDIPWTSPDGRIETKEERGARYIREWQDVKERIMYQQAFLFESATVVAGSTIPQGKGAFKSPILLEVCARALRKNYIKLWKLDKPCFMHAPVICACSTILRRVIEMFVPSQESKFHPMKQETPAILKDVVSPGIFAKHMNYWHTIATRKETWESDIQHLWFENLTGAAFEHEDEETSGLVVGPAANAAAGGGEIELMDGVDDEEFEEDEDYLDQD